MTSTTPVPPELQRLPASRDRGAVVCTIARTHGPVTRLVSPSDIGELIKPFVFVDYFDMVPKRRSLFRLRPHSGIATHRTARRRSALRGHTGAAGTLSGGSIEWRRAGGRVVVGDCSMHTSTDALRRGEADIARIGSRLRHEGRIPPAAGDQLVRSFQ